MNRIFSLIIVSFIATFFHFTARAQGTSRRHGRGEGGSSTTTAMFGCNSGGCTGRGVCKSTLLKNSGGCPGTVFACNSDGSLFTITVDVATIDTSSYFVWRPLCRCNPGTTVTFDFPFDISVNCYTVPYVDTFNLPAGTIIPAGVAFPVTYAAGHGDHQMATINIAPQTCASQTNYVIFGTPADGATINNQAQGIAQISAGTFSVTTSQNTTATAVQTTFMLKPGAADTLVMVFKNRDLVASQPLQAPNFDFTTNTYGNGNMFNTPACLPPQLTGTQGIGLPVNSVLPGPNNIIRISQSSDGKWDSIFVAYFPLQLPGQTYVQILDDTLLNVMYSMDYNPPSSSMSAWGWGNVSIYSYTNDINNAQLVVNGMQSNGGGSPGWPININAYNMTSNLNYYYTITLAYLTCTPAITLTSPQYTFNLPSQQGGADGFIQKRGNVEVRTIKTKAKTKKKK